MHLDLAQHKAFNAAVYVVLGIIVLLPIFSVPIPGLGDYLNHLARIHILTHIGRSADLQRFYEVRWNFAPYLGMDLIVSALTTFMSIYQAGRLFAALCVLMPVTCAVALRYAVQRRIGLLPASAFLLSYNYLLCWGFLNYIFSAGLAILLFAAWVASAHWRPLPRVAAFAVGMLIVYFGHVIACAAYGVMVAGYEIARACRAGFRPPGRIAALWGVAAAQSIPTTCFALALNIREAAPGPMVSRYGDIGTKLRAVLSPLLFPGSEILSLATIAAGLCALIFFLRTQRLRLAPDIWPAAFAVALIAVFVPSVVMGLWGYDFRLPLLAAILIAGAVSIAGPIPVPARVAAVAVLVLLAELKSLDAAASFHAVAGQIAQIRQVLTALPPGQRLLVIEVDDPPAPGRLLPYAMTVHMPMAAVIDRDAFVPNLFTGLNLVHFRKSLTQSSSPNAPPIGLAQLREGLTRTDDPAKPAFFNFGARVYWYSWPRKFDYVLILTFGSQTPDLPSILQPVRSSDIVALYKITS